MRLTELARKTDISCVQAFHTRDEIDAMIEAAIHCRFAAAFTLPAFSSYVAEKLAPYPDIHAGGVISFPGAGILPARNTDRQKNCVKPDVRNWTWL